MRGWFPYLCVIVALFVVLVVEYSNQCFHFHLFDHLCLVFINPNFELRVKEAIGRSRGNSGGFARAIAEKVSPSLCSHPTAAAAAAVVSFLRVILFPAHSIALPLTMNQSFRLKSKSI